MRVVKPELQYKADFVENVLKPFLLELQNDLKDIRYVNVSTPNELDPYFQKDAYNRNFFCGNFNFDTVEGEWIILFFTTGGTRGIDVSADSFLAMTQDVLKYLNY